MGRDLYETYAESRAVFDEAERILGFPLARLCFDGPDDLLRDTANAQPALLTTSIACWQAVRSLNPRLDPPAFAAGHSLGEYTALVVADSLDFTAALRLVRERGRLMKEAGERHPGAMAAVLGLDDATLEEICRQASKQTAGRGVVCANYNSPGQIVISGETKALELAVSLAKVQGAKRVIPLAVTVAGHSPLLREAAEEFAAFVNATPLREPTIPVIANVSARPMRSVEEIRRELVQQLTSPVRWTGSVEWMVEQGATRFIEIGPKDVLTGLIKRTAPNVQATSVGDVAGIEAFAA
jgi:[acyl-carrier-protein] S-malonyltransferase